MDPNFTLLRILKFELLPKHASELDFSPKTTSAVMMRRYVAGSGSPETASLGVKGNEAKMIKG